jgi:hypothetical protein
MNKTGFQIRNNYFRAALYMKLIVDNMKYRGIQCDFGRLTNVFFVTPDSLSVAVQRDSDFFQYAFYDRVFNPAQKGVLNKAGFTLHKCNIPRVIMHECENPEHETGNRSLVTACPTASVRRGHLSFVTCNLKPVTPARLRQSGGCNPEPETNEISTVFKIKKPSATETRFPAKGCISGSQAIRACLVIRVFNN